MLIFDIETGPLDNESVAKFSPEFAPPPHPGEFNPAGVKFGNLKDEAKRAAKLEEAKTAHADAVANYESSTAAAKAAHLADCLANAALSPLTGRVLAIGFQTSKGVSIEDGGGDEEDLLNRFWAMYAKCRAAAPSPRKMVGANIFGFDLPFLVRRSWILQVEFPQSVRNGRYFDSMFVDLCDVWLCGQRFGSEPASLDVMSRALGIGQKNGSGAEFARLWQEDRAKAIEYLTNDLAITTKVAERLGVG
jgi:hypothetical protein